MHHDFTKFHALKPKLLEAVDRMLTEEIGRLMNMVPSEEQTMAAAHKIQGGVFTDNSDAHATTRRGRNAQHLQLSVQC